MLGFSVARPLAFDSLFGELLHGGLAILSSSAGISLEDTAHGGLIDSLPQGCLHIEFKWPGAEQRASRGTLFQHLGIGLRRAVVL